MTAEQEQVEALCEVMHDAYEVAALAAGWETQERSRKPWSDVPEANKATMRAAVAAMLRSESMAEHDAQVRAEATAAVTVGHWIVHQETGGPFVTIVCACGEKVTHAGSFSFADLLSAHIRAALTPDAGAALRAREAKAWARAHDVSCDMAGNCWGGGCPLHENPYRDALEAGTES